MFIKWFKEWNYWRKYHPDYGIIHIGKVLIKKLGDGDTERYKINLPIAIECKNNDELNHMFLDCTKLQANLTIRSKTSRKIIYTLKYELGTPRWTVRYSHPLEKANYTLSGYSPYIKAGLGYVAECRIVNLGIVTLNNYQKILTNKHWFLVKVDWSKIEIPTSHKGDSQN